ncbi:anti-sigma factor [Sphingomonas sp. AOB5]|uniref:anti-sigma factor n=1 Tax=Sphingomonas sp. AOB5 TaxID=3034017 RepID=UPI0023F6E4B4|nr:anti-sigma factor [Sphingomonas sp. AOB5]MDF7776911.1 anti-sigma factor [Sphingomonas sp. AOB5]
MAEAAMTPEERDTLAGELALGVLEGEERAQALRLMLTDDGFAAEVDAWRDRLEPLCLGFGDVAPSNLWPSIERRLGTGGNVRALRIWRWSAIGSGALAASLAAVLLFRPLPQPVEIVRMPDKMAVAQLAGGEGATLLAANYDPVAGELRIRAVTMPTSELAPELWVIPEDGVPRSLGLVSAEGMSKMTVAEGHRKMIHDGATLAITMELRDGAPHAAPSSAPIAAGKISTI